MKKVLSLYLSILLMLSVSVPVYATSFADPDPAACLPEEYKPYSDAYILFSTMLEEEGYPVTVSLEEFVWRFVSEPGILMHEFVVELVATEMVEFNGRLENAVVSADTSVPEEHLLMPMGSISSRYYDNIGESLNRINIAQNPNYSKYDIISQAARGDIIYETVGLVAGIVGHIAIVQGKYYSSAYGKYYIRTVESALDGVVLGILDDTRYDERGVYLYYVYDASSTVRSNAVDFCVDQLGKDYNFGGLPGGAGTYCNVSRGSNAWYCSELIWAAYFNEGNGINL